MTSWARWDTARGHPGPAKVERGAFEGREQAPTPILLGAGGGRPLPCCSWGAEPNICSRLRAVPSLRSCEEARARPARAQRVSAPEHPSREDAAGSPQPCWRGPQALQCLAASSTITVTWDRAWGVPWARHTCTALPIPKAAASAPFHAHEQSQGSTWLTRVETLPLQWDAMLPPFPPPTSET